MKRISSFSINLPRCTMLAAEKPGYALSLIRSGPNTISAMMRENIISMATKIRPVQPMIRAFCGDCRYGARNSSTATSDIHVVGVMLARVSSARE
ncbi:hypothetical protein D3C75_915840 [compost metagenome]